VGAVGTMTDSKTGRGPIPEATARQLCARIRSQKASKLFTQCWGCVRATKGVEEKMCFFKPPDFRGCGLVNAQFDSSASDH
jgi:hypothetical protein